jgi:glycosyltransferase involved in cell wall biosynthesis
LAEFDAPPDTARLDGLRRRFGLDRPYWIHLGTIEPRKNLPRLIRAHGRLRARRADCPPLLLAGAEGWKAEETLAAAAGAPGGVTLTGYLDRADAVALLRGAAGCVYPSLYEGFGLPVLEAMAARVPVLASNAAALVELSGGACLHAEATSEDALEEGLERLMDDTAGSRERVAAGHARARERTWDHSAALLAAAYRRFGE